MHLQIYYYFITLLLRNIYYQTFYLHAFTAWYFFFSGKLKQWYNLTIFDGCFILTLSLFKTLQHIRQTVLQRSGSKSHMENVDEETEVKLAQVDWNGLYYQLLDIINISYIFTKDVVWFFVIFMYNILYELSSTHADGTIYH